MIQRICARAYSASLCVNDLDCLRLAVSRALVNEDAGSGAPKRRYPLPPRDDPGYEAAAASTLLEAAREGETASAEEATGFYWGEPRLHPHVRHILARAEADGDERLAQLAGRFLR